MAHSPTNKNAIELFDSFCSLGAPQQRELNEHTQLKRHCLLGLLAEFIIDELVHSCT
jgi:hypothetical protein